MREVTLPVELKDPFIAYSLGLVPFYSAWAANYVGFSRVQGMAPPDIAWSGFNQTVGDLVLLAGGIWLSSQAAGKPSDVAAPMVFGSAFCYAAIPTVHVLWHAPYWGRKAASFNKSSLELHGYKHEAEIAPRARDYD